MPQRIIRPFSDASGNAGLIEQLPEIFQWCDVAPQFAQSAIAKLDPQKEVVPRENSCSLPTCEG